MDITEASAKTNCPDEKQDLMDDHLIHRDDDKVVEDVVPPPVNKYLNTA